MQLLCTKCRQPAAFGRLGNCPTCKGILAPTYPDESINRLADIRPGPGIDRYRFLLPTETPLLPSPTPFQGNGEVCVILFNDINGNAVAEEGEAAIPNGAIDISDRMGRVSQTGTTSGSIEEPTCFQDLPEGDYNISLAVPDGYNPTTRMNYAQSGWKSLMKKSRRKFNAILKKDAEFAGPFKEAMIKVDKRWGKLEYWQSLSVMRSKYTAGYYWNAIDRK